MPLAELTHLPIERLALLLRSREVSPVELTAAFLQRIAMLDGQLNTFITVMAEEAMAAAKAAEEEIVRTGSRGPLHGVPLGIKDLYDVAGVPNTAGSEILRDNIPERDATAVRRLRSAGAIILGKQNMHEFAFGVTCENDHHGDVHNPWDPERIAGGSSGGTAAAIAAGLCAGGIGTDTGGSIRIPAAMCGVVGLKPTYGRVSRHGVLPLAWSMDHGGPLARTVADAALLLQAIAGPDPDDATTLGVPYCDFGASLGRPLTGLRLGVPQEHFWDVIEPEVAEAVRKAIDTLADLGAVVAEVHLPSAVHSSAAFTAIIGSEAASWHEPWLQQRQAEYGAEVLTRLLGGAATPATSYLEAERLRAVIQQEFAKALEQVDALVTPTVPMVAPRLHTTLDLNPALGMPARGAINRNTCPVNLTGLPAVSVPCGLAGGLPVGLQIIGRAWEEPLVLQVAHAYLQAVPFHGPPQAITQAH